MASALRDRSFKTIAEGLFCNSFAHQQQATQIANTMVKTLGILRRKIVTKEQSRKPIDPEDICMICREDLLSVEQEELLWCQAQCGQNYHKMCVDAWHKTYIDHQKTCCFCSTQWIGEYEMKPDGFQDTLRTWELGYQHRRSEEGFVPLWVRIEQETDESEVRMTVDEAMEYTATLKVEIQTLKLRVKK
jgi:hypothetical protein